jgi:transcriptional regulator with XRE-family HTH domain
VRTDELATRRKALGLTVRQLATLCGVAASTVVRWEQGSTPTRGNHAEAYAAALEIDVSDLLDVCVIGRTTP